MSTLTKSIFGAFMAAGLALGAGAAMAQDGYPNEPVHLVVAWPPGGGHDIAARLLGVQLSEALKVPVVVDNVSGAGGSTGVRHLEKAKPDGYTIGVIGMHAVSQSFMNTNATALDQLEPLAYISDEPGALEVTAATGINTLEEYVEKVKADPSAVINGNDAQGGNSFVFANMLSDVLGVPIVQIPYQGHGPNVTALITNEIGSATLPIPPVLESARNGTVKVLGVMSEERHPMVPDVPTFKEQGYDLVGNDFLMIAGPVGIPDEVKAVLEAGLLAAINSPGFTEAATKNGMVLRPGDAAMAATELTEQVEVIYPLLDKAGLVDAALKRQ